MSAAAATRLRAATASDAGAIRLLIFRVGINPRDLDWRRFLVAVDEAGKLIGCGRSSHTRRIARAGFDRGPTGGARSASNSSAA
jgi:hypothetical protein